MLKEYTLKVTCRVGGETEDECEEKISTVFNEFDGTWEITHEEVVEPEVEQPIL